MLKFLGFTVLVILIVVAMAFVLGYFIQPTPAGPAVAPEPDEHPEAVIQVYGADVWGVRGRFAIHTWVATKPRHANTYTIYQVIGWRLRQRGTALDVSQGMPARPWFRSPPILLHDIRGSEADALIPRISEAVERYPYAKEYTMWPGPNSNSFTEWIALEVPELKLELPFKAIGKNWMADNYPGPGPQS